MKAVVFDRFGDPDVLRIADIPVPEPASGEVVVRVAASTVNPTDLMMRRGEQARLMSDLVPPYTAGMEFSGRVHSAGEGVPLRAGQPVIGVVNPRRPEGGAHAEFVRIPAASVAVVPGDTDLVSATTVPMNALTAMLALGMLGLTAGQSVLITGGAGQLGSSAIQLALNDGLVVLANVAGRDAPMLRGWGVTHVLPRDDGLEAALREIRPDGVDGLIDGALIGATISHLVRDGGGAVSLRGSHPIEDPRLTSGYVSILNGIEDSAKIRRVADLLNAGVLSPRVAPGGVFPFADAAEAHRMAERGDFRGRVVLDFAERSHRTGG